MTGRRMSEGLEQGTVADGAENDEDRVGIEGTVRVEFGARLRVLGRGSHVRSVLQHSATALLLRLGPVSRFRQQGLSPVATFPKFASFYSNSTVIQKKKKKKKKIIKNSKK